jgi:hypothetical protein
VFRRGDYANAMTGAQGWNPITAPSAGVTFFGLDRGATDVVRVSGSRHSGSGSTKEETLIDADAAGAIHGAEVNTVFCHPNDYRDLVKEMGAKQVIDVPSKETGIGFKGLMVNGQMGSINVLSDRDVPEGYAWMMDVNNYYLRTSGDCPKVLNEDGAGMLLRATDDDAYQGRIGCYGNFTCENPGHTVIITW